MKQAGRSATLYLLLVFVSGVLVGSFGHRLYNSRSVVASTERRTPEDYRRQYVGEMRSRLNLTDEQTAKLNVVLDETRARFKETRKKIDPAMKQIHEDQVRQIEAMLNEEQRLEYTKFREERERQRQLEKKSGPGC